MKYLKFSLAIAAVVATTVSLQAAANQLYDGGLNDNVIYRFSSTGVRSVFVSGVAADSLAFDSKGNLFAVNTTAQSIVKITPAGVVTTFATGVTINGLAIDSAGNIFATDGPTNSIFKYTPAGVRTVFATALNGPVGIAIDRNDNLYVTVNNGGIANSGFIAKFTPTGTKSTFVASGLFRPQGIVVDGLGNVYEADLGTNRVLKFTVSGSTVTQSTFATGPNVNGPRSLAFDRSGNLYVGEFGSQTITKITRAGVQSTFNTSPPTTFVGGLAFEPPTSELTNLSTRASIQTGDRVSIAGFVIRGTASKRVVVRGLGPTLGRPPFNVSGSLQNPTLQLLNGNGALLASNDDWQNAANASQIPTKYRPPDSRESAILTTLARGSYTAILAGKASTTGVGLAEVYDLDSYANLAELVNVSTRAFVGTNDAVTIGGFVAGGGNGVIEVVVRGLGPTLAQPPFNVSGVLANPQLTLANANGTTVASNNNWRDDTLQAVVQFAGYAPPQNSEAAILRTLTANTYTAILSGVNGTTGIGLVEVYKVLR